MIVAVALGIVVTFVLGGMVVLPAIAASDSKDSFVSFIGILPLMAFCAIIPAFIVVLIMNPPTDQMWPTLLLVDLGIAFVCALLITIADARQDQN
jgi:hypothetical protein